MISSGIGTAHPYADFLHLVEKPARYTGGEVGSVVRAWEPEVATFCLAFPDVYDIGMSHLGFRILYKILNEDPRTLAERCYAPWVDMEEQLRARGLPLISLESQRPLRDFDVVGFSLQFELTYTNILTMLDLGGIPLRAVDRGEDDPLVVAGGPVATHPEPIAPFLDAIVIGDGEEVSTTLASTWKTLKRAGVPRAARLRALAAIGGVYVPSLYATRLDEGTGLQVVAAPRAPADGAAPLPFPIRRGLIDINAYPFPDEGPTGGPEAIFDRMSIEIARGCTEGCRFCQAGMIYRTVRERDPEEIVKTVVAAVKKGGHDEVALTALSTADVSCISPLIKKVNESLAGERVKLGVASLRAYGLAPDLLDELKGARAGGLTFAPEAGTQRMRDVINKNVTEEQLLETAHNVFSRGWDKMKLYFICGLPTETDEDVLGIVQTGARALAVGKRTKRSKPAEVTVSVSVHIPKPHTPFQWCAMDDLATVERKQRMLRNEARGIRGMKLRTHDANGGVIEAIFARGDRPLADVLERAWRNGARFDSWDEKLKLDVWKEALVHFEIDTDRYLGTMPITARLPWSHIDVGLEDGFLAREYKKSLASRLSPPCGKIAGQFVHHDTVEAARAETKRLVCYDCGVACDMTQMREERIAFLERLGAPKRLPVVSEGESESESESESAGVEGSGESEAEEGGGQGEGEPVAALEEARDEVHLDGQPIAPVARFKKGPKTSITARKGQRVRFKLEKLGGTALLGHLDLVRELPRIFRRVGLRIEWTNGFHAKPEMVFSPALGLGVASLHELCDVRLLDRHDPAELALLCRAMTERAPKGLAFVEARALEPGEGAIPKTTKGARYAIAFGRKTLEPEATGDLTAEAWLAERAASILALPELRVRRDHTGIGRMVDVRRFLADLRPWDDEARADVARAGLFGDIVGVVADVHLTNDGGIRPNELASIVIATPGPDGACPQVPNQTVRVSLTTVEESATRPAAELAIAPSA
jgi:radical SAM family uncharacterized protein/radical SAM-linked protein